MKQASTFFARYPRLLSGVTGGLTFALGDVIAQCFESPKSFGAMGTMGILKHNVVNGPPHHKEPGSEDAVVITAESIDVVRILRTAVYGSVMNGLILYQWFRVVDYAFGSSMAGAKTVLLKMLADQIVYAPFSISVYFGVSSLKIRETTVHKHSSILGQRDPTSHVIELRVAEFITKMKESFWPTYAADWTVWPAVNAINFRFVPLHLRPTFVCCAQLCWGAYLSSVTNNNRINNALFNKQDNDTEENPQSSL
jgi:hypothetical protein